MKRLSLFLILFLFPVSVLADDIPLEESFADVLLQDSFPCSTTSYSEDTLYCFNNSKTDMLKATSNYRFIGNSSNNYVNFNNEVYRILGVFTTEDESGNFHNSVKLIKGSYLDSVVYDSTKSNNWSSSSIRDYLNVNYYNTLSEDNKNLIQKAKYYLGGISDTNSMRAIDYYTAERTGTSYSYDNIAIMYASDLAYTYANDVDNKCFTDGLNCRTIYGGKPSASFLFNNSGAEWLLTPYSEYILMHGANGFIGNFNIATDLSFNIKPVFYLKDNVVINSGDGTSSNPYVLKSSDKIAILGNVENGSATLSKDNNKILINVEASEGYVLDLITAIAGNHEYTVLKNDENNYYFEYDVSYGSINVSVTFKKDNQANPDSKPEGYSYKFKDNNYSFDASKNDSFKLVIDADNTLFESLYIDDVKLEYEKDYIVTKGSTIITFTSSGINKLKKFESGNHKITVNFTNGKTVTKNISVASIEPPNTYDNVIIYILSIPLLSIGIIYLFKIKAIKP